MSTTTHTPYESPCPLGTTITERVRIVGSHIMASTEGLLVNDDAHRARLQRVRRCCPGSLVTNASPRGTVAWRAQPFTEDNYGRSIASANGDVPPEPQFAVR